MERLLLVALGGSVGAGLRYLTSGLVHRYLDGTFPWGTLTVNVIGSFVLGLVWALSEEMLVSPGWRASVMVGGIGAFTTFSTYSLETFNLARYGDLNGAILNFLLNNSLGILSVVFGFTAGKFLIGFLRRTA